MSQVLEERVKNRGHIRHNQNYYITKFSSLPSTGPIWFARAVIGQLHLSGFLFSRISIDKANGTVFFFLIKKKKHLNATLFSQILPQFWLTSDSWLTRDSRFAVVRFSITRMITGQIGLHSVLLPLLIRDYGSWWKNQNLCKSEFDPQTSTIFPSIKSLTFLVVFFSLSS